ncbi:MAG: SRPBCC domain-containing protein [Paracoccaceae bacterium]
MDIYHETLVFEREFSTTPDSLFEAYADPKQREVWSAPTPETIIVIDESDVQTGGREIARCGSAENLSWTMKVAYHSVITNRLITFTEELWDGDSILTIALITFDFQSSGTVGTKLKLTDQVTSLVGEGGVAGHRDGYTKALANLAASLVSA